MSVGKQICGVSEPFEVQTYVKLVKGIAQHLMMRFSYAVQIEDLIQAGMVGLLEAGRKYDENKGASFETYASIRIRGSMLDEVRRNDWTPRSVYKDNRRIAQAVRSVENSVCRDPRDREVAENLNMTLDEYHQLLMDTQGTRMFAMSDLNVDEETLFGTFESEDTLIDNIQKDICKIVLRKGIEGLTQREQLVLQLYYDKEMNLKEIGAQLGVTESRISQIHSQAMSKLKVKLQHSHYFQK